MIKKNKQKKTKQENIINLYKSAKSIFKIKIINYINLKKNKNN
jgi:hypothetical protein